ncbi:MAG: HAMP domain-containing histidine kinase [Oscillospiraceae bacterium]|nr:HAMP domain-containing histidine kinase [Oscillospiraceae bacterium]
MKHDESGLKLFCAYLRYRLKSIVALNCFLLIFLVVYLLYRVDPEAYLYAALLTLVVIAAIVWYDFWKYRKKHLLLRDALGSITVTLDRLPEPGHLIERDYRELLELLHRERAEIVSQSDGRLSEMVDYYTLWAHQIKTPISAMRLLLQSGDGSSPELEQELFKIEQYVEMVLQYLRLESLSGDLRLEGRPLDELVRQAVKKYSVVFIHKKISLRLEELPGRVLTDEKWIVFVLEQLLSNALKYTPPGGSISLRMAPGTRKTLILEDTGIGIQPEDLPRIFERGFTGYNGRMDKKSTGIGLYLCREILGKLGHTIRISSEPGSGTRVFLDFSREEIEIE